METNQIRINKRTDTGLIEGVEYKFTPEGSVDWRAMVPKEFLYLNTLNKDKIEKKYGKALSEISISDDNVEDVDLVILLAGIKYISRLRGFNSVSFNIKESSEQYAAVNCRIVFIPNFETEGREIDFEDNACATLQNTNSFATRYLLEIATNRAFCRAVRSFLGINIVSKEELAGPNEVKEEAPKSPIAPQRQIKMLDEIMKAKNVKWENLVKKMQAENTWNEAYKATSDLPKDIVADFIERIKKM